MRIRYKVRKRKNLPGLWKWVKIKTRVNRWKFEIIAEKGRAININEDKMSRRDLMNWARSKNINWYEYRTTFLIKRIEVTSHIVISRRIKDQGDIWRIFSAIFKRKARLRIQVAASSH